MVFTEEFDHGFIHRLDIPSSGLILTGTSFEGLYWIRWQLNVYFIEREYYVMCQGLMRSELNHIDLPIDVRTHKLGSHRSITGDHGGPAFTWVCATAHVCKTSCISSPQLLACNDTYPVTHGRDSSTPVCIRIRTGRKHQIRTHLRSSGHPSVVDGMYAVLDIVMTNLRPYEVGYVHAGCPGELGSTSPF